MLFQCVPITAQNKKNGEFVSSVASHSFAQFSQYSVVEQQYKHFQQLLGPV